MTAPKTAAKKAPAKRLPTKNPATRTPAKRKPVPTVQDTDVELDKQLAESLPEVVDPGYDGHRLRVQGLPWAEVATKIGAPNAQSAMRTVSSYLAEAARSQSSQQMQEALTTQVDRYEAILASWWYLATTGKDEKAATVVLRAMERLDRVLRLTEGDVVVSRETLVVSADPAEYTRQLQSVVEERAQRVAR